MLGRETFYRELAEMDRLGKVLEAEYARRFGEALAEKVAAYQDAMTQLVDIPGWAGLNDDARAQIAAGLQAHANDDGAHNPSINQGPSRRTRRPASLACDRLSRRCTSSWTVSGS